MRGIHVTVISHHRPQNVPKIQALCGEDITWYVGKGEGRDYESFGAKRVVEAGGLCESRNMALSDSFQYEYTCVEISDDFAGVKFLQVDSEGKKTAVPINFELAVEYMDRELSKTPFKLAGVAPTPNAFYYHKEFSDNLFIVGDFIMVKPCNLRFDENMRLKEDYDYTVQHIKQFGGALRLNKVLATFAHRTNKGGAVDYRTSNLEQETIAYLMRKHPDSFRMNPRRKDEILLIKKKK